jgi:hypothetical protein
MNRLKVECYSGYKAEQYPKRFTLGAKVLDVEEIADQWYSPSARYFKVRASDGSTYILRHDEEADSWTLDAFRR